jgi:hypothetical protein
MKGKAMNELQVWQKGLDEGLNLAIKLVNEWCGLECKTISELIHAVNQMKEVAHD